MVIIKESQCCAWYSIRFSSKISHLTKISLKFRRRTVIIGRFLWPNGLGTGPVLMWSRDHRTFESRSSGRSWALKNAQRTTFLLVWVLGLVEALFKSLFREERKTGRGSKEWLVCPNQWGDFLRFLGPRYHSFCASLIPPAIGNLRDRNTFRSSWYHAPFVSILLQLGYPRDAAIIYILGLYPGKDFFKQLYTPI